MQSEKKVCFSFLYKGQGKGAQTEVKQYADHTEILDKEWEKNPNNSKVL